jgi:hypothetical protein
LITRNTDGFTVAFADLTPELLLDFNNNVPVTHNVPTTCFDVVMVDTDIAIVDCQVVNTTKIIDRHYIVNAATKNFTYLELEGIVATTSNLCIKIRTKDYYFEI